MIPNFTLPLPLNFYEASRFVPLIGWTPLTDTRDKQKNRQTDNQTNGCVSLSLCLFVCVCLRWSLTLRALNLRVEIAGSIPAAKLLSPTLDKLFTHIASVTKRYNLIPAWWRWVNRHAMQHTGPLSIVLQLPLMPGWGPQNRWLAATQLAKWLEKVFSILSYTHLGRPRSVSNNTCAVCTTNDIGQTALSICTSKQTSIRRLDANRRNSYSACILLTIRMVLLTLLPHWLCIVSPSIIFFACSTAGKNNYYTNSNNNVLNCPWFVWL